MTVSVSWAVTTILLGVAAFPAESEAVKCFSCTADCREPSAAMEDCEQYCSYHEMSATATDPGGHPTAPRTVRGCGVPGESVAGPTRRWPAIFQLEQCTRTTNRLNDVTHYVCFCTRNLCNRDRATSRGDGPLDALDSGGNGTDAETIPRLILLLFLVMFGVDQFR